MGLFGKKETAEEKRQRELKKFAEKYNLDTLDEKDLELVKRVASDLVGNGLIKFGASFSAKSEDVAKISYLSALVEQNWIIVNQLSRLNMNIEKLLGEKPNVKFEELEYKN